jgi:hypothetical protein
MFDRHFGQKPAPKGGPIIPEPTSALGRGGPGEIGRVGATYSKVFRWRLPDGQTKPPATVEVAGTFSHWQKVPLQRDSSLDAWHVTIHHIPGNRTHHYMLFVDGQPAQDKNCDGMAVAHGPQEEQFAIQTVRGPRVFMIFAQTK